MTMFDTITGPVVASKPERKVEVGQRYARSNGREITIIASAEDGDWQVRYDDGVTTYIFDRTIRTMTLLAPASSATACKAPTWCGMSIIDIRRAGGAVYDHYVTSPDVMHGNLRYCSESCASAAAEPAKAEKCESFQTEGCDGGPYQQHSAECTRRCDAAAAAYKAAGSLKRAVPPKAVEPAKALECATFHICDGPVAIRVIGRQTAAFCEKAMLAHETIAFDNTPCTEPAKRNPPPPPRYPEVSEDDLLADVEVRR